MRPSHYTITQEQRIDRLFSFSILDTLDEAVFNKIAEDLAVILNLRGVVISFMNHNREWFRVCAHLPEGKAEQLVILCDYVLQFGQPVSVSDVQNPDRYRLPLPAKVPGVQSFLGVPLATPDGYRLGAIVGICKEPHQFTARDIDIMQRFSARVISELEQRLLRAEFEQVNEDLQTIMAHSPSGYVLLDDREKIIGLNPAAERITGVLWQQGETFNWKALKKDSKVSSSREEPVYSRWVGQGWFQLTRIPMQRKDRTLLVFEDITDHVEYQLYLQDIAFKDQVTAAENRHAFYAYLRSRFRSGPFAVAFLDLDHFKQVNDTHGHQAGDEVLKEVAQRLKHAVRTQDRVYRLAGDEFTVILGGDVSDDMLTQIADRILKVMREPFHIEENHIHIGVSIGITRAIAGESVDALLKRADSLMYEVKQAGRFNFRMG
ncbi:diguanylate cyclase domain-containing protein [Deinococcus cellulosilyticus]|uniref:GGDEF domain-containing protein n=1 Tax=Deinococcus cellulosilyticus (strain DSM 18568 / NBRC 106333 / KACC 11606 / 5516J-15) TaxID=1223518 RepID=A0A511N386_DEIC1|nr:diguanylate cyclase [Deinococcus cellulosilyticus]GEM47302.1 hypothetical protein DC3_29370 [Deinococcus cellulosilyticus NBRC 106333 = KACC 11606]